MNSAEMKRDLHHLLYCEECGCNHAENTKRITTVTRTEEVFWHNPGNEPINDVWYENDQEEHFLCWSCNTPATWRQNAILSRIFALSWHEYLYGGDAC